MKRVRIEKILKNGRALYLAYDQGMEHGPSWDFDEKNVDPLYILDIAKKGNYNAVIFQKGIAEKYLTEIKKSRIPLILKLNGKTNLRKGEPISAQIATVKEALQLGAVAVGYTIYIGSEHEAKMIEQFGKIEQEAHANGLPVIAWIYPRGKGLEGRSEREILAYAARVGLEVGADIVKIHWKTNLDDLKWAVKSAGRTKVVIAGGNKKPDDEFLTDVKNIMKSGAVGLAVGRNVWQNKRPLELSNKIRKIIFG